jgi:hypothetical protein
VSPAGGEASIFAFTTNIRTQLAFETIALAGFGVALDEIF